MTATPEIVRELLHYNPITGVFTWRNRGERWFKTGRDCRLWNARFAGKRAGGIYTNGKGYRGRAIRILNRSYKEGRLAWMYMTDQPLPPQIDHENRDATDTRWLNIRPSSHADNNRNRSMHRNNTSGITGVSWDKRSCRWMAQCMIKGRNRYLGHFDDRDKAGEAVAEFRDKHGFYPGHGKESPDCHIATTS